MREEFSVSHTVDFDCPNCGKSLQWDVAASAKAILCPHCGKIVQIPEPIQAYGKWSKPLTERYKA